MKSAPLLVTFALAISAIMLGESLKSVEPSFISEGRPPTNMELAKGLMKEVGKRVLKKMKDKINKITKKKSTAVEIEKDLPCGSLIKGVSEWTVMVTVEDEADTFLFPTLIGERTAIATDSKHWMKQVSKYKAYIPKERYLPFAFDSAAEFWELKKIYRRSEKPENEAILISFDQKFPVKLVPACLPMPGAFHMESNTEFFITAYFRGSPADKRISLYYENMVQKPDQKECGQMVRMQKPDHPYQRMYAPSGPVMARVGKRYMLIGITQSTNTKEPDFRKIFTDDQLKWIDSEAEKNDLSTAKMLPP